MLSGRHTRIAIASAVCLCLQVTAASAQQAGSPKSAAELAQRLGVRTLAKGSSSRGDKRKAIKALPLQALTSQARPRVDQILKKVSQFRKLPAIQTSMDPAAFHYFLDHPDVAVSLWRVMDISDFQLQQTGNFRFEADAGDGSRGNAEYVYRDNRQALLVCDGIYKNPVLSKPIMARALVHLQYQFQPGPAGQPPILTQQINAYISFPSTAVMTVAKVISPVTNKIMDRNCLEITVFLKVMSDAMQTRPQWVQTMAGRMDGVMPVRRTELSDLAMSVNTASRSRGGKAFLQDKDPSRSMLPISGNTIRQTSQSSVIPRR